jgi:hypothetical protein
LSNEQEGCPGSLLLLGWQYQAGLTRMAKAGPYKAVFHPHAHLAPPAQPGMLPTGVLPDFLLDICHVFRKLTAFHTTDSNTIYKEIK